MKKQLKFTNKQTAIGLAVAANVTALLLVVSLIPRSATGGFDLDGLNQQVQKQGEELDNHEARITNTENDVNDLQQKTGTAPSQNRQTVPSVTTPAPAPSTATPAPAPAPTPTVVNVQRSVQKNPSNSFSYMMTCRYIWSDGNFQYRYFSNPWTSPEQVPQCPAWGAEL